MCRIRDYRPGDEARVFEIVKKVLTEYGLPIDPVTTDADLEDIGRSYIAPGGTFRILEHDGQTIGFYGLYAMSPETCELRKMYLLPEFRGRGLGRRLLDDALAEAKSRSFHEMTLETNSCLREAVRLYRTYGFTECPHDHPLACRCDLAMKRAV